MSVIVIVTAITPGYRVSKHIVSRYNTGHFLFCIARMSLVDTEIYVCYYGLLSLEFRLLWVSI